MAQKGFDTLRYVTESRYLLSEIVGQRAAQLKRGVPSTVTGKVVPSTQNSVTAAMEEIELGTGVIWGNDVSNAGTIKRAVEADEQTSKELQKEYSISRANDLSTSTSGRPEDNRFGSRPRT